MVCEGLLDGLFRCKMERQSYEESIGIKEQAIYLLDTLWCQPRYTGHNPPVFKSHNFLALKGGNDTFKERANRKKGSILSDLWDWFFFSCSYCFPHIWPSHVTLNTTSKPQKRGVQRDCYLENSLRANHGSL